MLIKLQNYERYLKNWLFVAVFRGGNIEKQNKMHHFRPASSVSLSCQEASGSIRTVPALTCGSAVCVGLTVAFGPRRRVLSAYSYAVHSFCSFYFKWKIKTDPDGFLLEIWSCLRENLHHFQALYGKSGLYQRKEFNWNCNSWLFWLK